jgi:hypothetical protein
MLIGLRANPDGTLSKAHGQQVREFRVGAFFAGSMVMFLNEMDPTFCNTSVASTPRKVQSKSARLQSRHKLLQFVVDCNTGCQPVVERGAQAGGLCYKATN